MSAPIAEYPAHAGPPPTQFRRLEDWVLGLFFLVFVLVAMRPMYNIDIYWHIAVGDWIRGAGSLPDRDLFSAFTPDAPWRSFQWGYQVLVSFLDELGGLALVRWAHIALHGLALWLLLRLARARVRGVAALVVAILMVAYMDRIRVRPHVFNLLGVLALVAWMARFQAWRFSPEAQRSGWARGWRTVDLPIAGLALVWGNIHSGGVVVFIPVPMLLIALGVFLQKGPGLWPMIRAGTLTALVLVLSPGFLDGVLHAYGTLHAGTMSMLPEMNSSLALFTDPPAGRWLALSWFQGALPWLALIGVLGAGVREKREGLPQCLLSMFLVFLAVKHERFLFLVAFIPLIWPASVEAFRAGPRRLALVLLVATLAVAAFAAECFWTHRDGLGDHFAHIDVNIEPGDYPEGAAAFLAASGVEGRALVRTGWGGFLLHQSRGAAGPRLLTSSDGRHNFGAETAAHLDRADDAVARVHVGQGESSRELRLMQHDYLRQSLTRYPVDLMVLPPPVFRYNIHDRASFVLAYRGDVAEVYLVQNMHTAESLARIWSFYREQDPGVFDPRQDRCAFERFVWTRGAAMDSAQLGTWRSWQQRLSQGEPIPIKDQVQLMQLAQGLELEGHLEAAHEILTALAPLQPLTERLGLAIATYQGSLNFRRCVPVEARAAHLKRLKEAVDAMRRSARVQGKSPQPIFEIGVRRLFDSLMRHEPAARGLQP